MSKLSEVIKNLHDKACLEKQNGYFDPDSGLYVMTEQYLKNVGAAANQTADIAPTQRRKKHD